MNPTLVETTIYGFGIQLRLLGLISLLVSALIYPLFIRSMQRGERPPRSSWFLWAALDVVILRGQILRRVFDPMMVVYTIGTIVVALFTVKYGKRGWTWVETACTAIVALALGMLLFSNPTLATVCGLIGISVACIPVFEHVLRGGYADRLVWTLAGAASFINAADGQLLTGLWFGSLQVAVLVIVLYNWGMWRMPVAAEA